MRSTSSRLSPFTSPKLDLYIKFAVVYNAHRAFRSVQQNTHLFGGLGNSCLVMLGLNNDQPCMHRKTRQTCQKAELLLRLPRLSRRPW